MTHQPRALHCNHCIIPSALVWSALPWRSGDRAAGELLNYGFTTRLFHRAVPKDASSTVPVASRKMKTITNKPLAIPTPKAAKCLQGKRVPALLTAFSSLGMNLTNIKNFLGSFFSAKFQLWGLQLLIIFNANVRQSFMELKALAPPQFQLYTTVQVLYIFNLWPCLSQRKTKPKRIYQAWTLLILQRWWIIITFWVIIGAIFPIY